MHKYCEIAKIHIKSQLAWRGDVVFQMMFTMTKILFAYLLWGIIFGDQMEVAGFSFHSMLSYYIISSFLAQLELSDGISREISTRIRNGTFSKYMIIPVNIQAYFVAMEAGIVVYYGVFQFMTAFVWIFVLKIQFVFTNSLLLIAAAFFMIILGLLFMAELNYYLGLLTLKYQEISTFLMIKENLVTLVTGGIIPLVLLPEGLVSVMKLLPFYYVTYLPSMLLTGRLREEAVSGLLIISLWCVFLHILIKFTWENYRKTYDGVGI